MKKYTLIIGLMLLVAYINCGGNNAPVITNITFNPTTPMVGEDVTCTVTATDEDDDTLTFTWSADNGTFASTTGDSVTWTAPANAGAYTITVIASDESDADTLSDTITVRAVASIFGENTTVYPILDTILTVSTIDISGAPAGATVDSVVVSMNIIHLWTANLDITLFAPDSASVLLYDNNYPASGTDTIKTTTLAGSPVNGTWELHIFDEVVFDEGNLNWWNITIYYLE